MDRSHQTTTPRILGLTGPIACGKTTVGTILLELGAIERIDADDVVHVLQAPGTEVTDRIVGRFGDVRRPNGAVDRTRLGAIVFSDPVAMQELEAIIHPAVRLEIVRRIATLRGRQGVVVIDAVKLLHSDLLPLVEAVWYVRCSPREQMRRLIEDRALQPADAEDRVRSQPKFEHPKITAVIDNGGSIEELRSQVREAWEGFNAANA